MRPWNHPIVRLHVKDKISFIKNNLELGPGTTILEIGAGSGYFTQPLSSLGKVIATDANQGILRLNPVKNKRIADASNLPFDDNSFDVVMAFDVLHHLDHPEQAVSEMRRVSKKHVVIVEPNANNMLQKAFMVFAPKEWGTYRFTTQYLKDVILKSGLQILKFEHIGRLITPNIPLPRNLLDQLPHSNSAQLNLSNIAICKTT